MFAFSSISLLFFACGGNDDASTDTNAKDDKPIYDYSISIEAIQPKSEPPALQSFAIGNHDGDWLMFAGRTNADNKDGGLHNINGDYAGGSFPPVSFNPFIYVYNPETGDQSLINYWNLLNTIRFIADTTGNTELKSTLTLVSNKLYEYGHVFRCSNPEVTQDGEYLYLVGGYGPAKLDSSDVQVAFKTFDHIARIHIPTLMQIANRNWDLSIARWTDLFRFGRNSTLTCTGGEVFKIGDDFYLAGGHNFHNPDQVYLNCVYKFNVTQNASDLSLTATVTDTISDVPLDSLRNNPKWVDSTSTFRRRDGPIVPSLYLGADGRLKAGITFYAGVFTYAFGAWNDAIHITPEGEQPYRTDKTYNQNNCNVYSCPDFGIYDTAGGILHTFLPGGIGNGKTNPNSLSGFTNTLGHATYNVNDNASSFDTSPGAFPSTYFYGAEAEYIPSINVSFYRINGHSTGLIDAAATFTDDGHVTLGYIYGGIEAFSDSPGTYGPKNSGASNKVWKVTGKRVETE